MGRPGDENAEMIQSRIDANSTQSAFHRHEQKVE